MRISNCNIRATGLKQFWGTEFEDSIYLWEGAKSELTREEINGLDIPTIQNLFESTTSIDQGFERCKFLYFKYISRITRVLNDIHQINFPESFWITSFGHWLFRHICSTYEKFLYLELLDIQNVSLSLLDKRSFYIPYNHLDYLDCFAADFGVQQMVTQYVNLYGERNKYPEIPLDFHPIEFGRPKTSSFDDLKQKIKSLIGYDKAKFNNKHVVICGSYFNESVKNELLKSFGERILFYDRITYSSKNTKVDKKFRSKLLVLQYEDKFERFLNETLVYCIPRIFIEQFSGFFKYYSSILDGTSIKYIFSENWVSDVKTSLLMAVAQHSGIRFVATEHGASYALYKNTHQWIELLACDIYLSTGWINEKDSVERGGFTSRKIEPYIYNSILSDILFISHTRFKYLIDIGANNASNNIFINELDNVLIFKDLIPRKLRKHLIIRPRRAFLHWDTEKYWNFDETEIRVDRGSMIEAIKKSKIVIIDHLSTSFAELLLMRAPLVILHNPLAEFEDKYLPIMDKLEQHGIMHTSVESLAKHIEMIYDHVQEWWTSKEVRQIIDQLMQLTLRPEKNTIEYVSSLFKSH